VAAAEVADSVSVLTVISIYGLLENLHGTLYSITTLHRLFSDLTILLDDPRRRGRIVLGGDFNASLQWDERQGSKTHRLLFDRVEAFGLTSCLPYGGKPQRTWRAKSGDFPWQLDYLFISEELADRASPAAVVEDDRVAQLGDHNPIAVTVDLGDV
jgi:endonuclease/exonuclease/phosphatase family metal-dependent hydrolase